MVTRGSPSSVSKVIFRFVSDWCSPIHMGCHYLSMPYLTAYRKGHLPCTLHWQNEDLVEVKKRLLPSFFFPPYLGRERKCATGELKVVTTACEVCNGQDPLFKPCTSLSYLRHTEQKHKTAGQSGSLFTSHAIGIHRGNLKIPVQTMVSQNFIWWNCRLSIEGVASIHLVLSHMLLMLPLSNINWLWHGKAG